MMPRVLVFITYQPYARAPNTYWNYIFVFKFEQSSYLFSLKNSLPCRDLNPGPPRYQADMLTELSWLVISYFSFLTPQIYRLIESKSSADVIFFRLVSDLSKGVLLNKDISVMDKPAAEGTSYFF